MYQDELGRSGEALFRIRGYYIHIVIWLGTLLVWATGIKGPFESDTANCVWFWVAFAVAAGGAVWRIIVNGYAAKGTSGNQKQEAVASELNTTGPYSVVRNPLYVGRIVNFTGIAMLSGSWVYGALVFLISVLIYERISIYEENFLRVKFGAAHTAWAKDVPALLPRLHGWVKPKYKFWAKRAIRREYRKIFQLATAILLYDLARRGFDPANLPESLFWYYVWSAILLLRIGVEIVRRLGKFEGVI